MIPANSGSTSPGAMEKAMSFVPPSRTRWAAEGRSGPDEPFAVSLGR
jgi:hypothetical protein